jgi:hypothetical protein
MNVFLLKFCAKVQKNVYFFYTKTRISLLRFFRLYAFDYPASELVIKKKPGNELPG